MNAMPPAAAVPERNIDGNGQKHGLCAYTPMAATDMAAIAQYRWDVAPAATSPTAATTDEDTMCHRRSWRRSDEYAQSTIPIAPMAYGMAVTNPVDTFDRPCDLTISGRKNVMPYVAVTIVK